VKLPKLSEWIEVSKANLWVGLLSAFAVSFIGGFLFVYPRVLHIGELLAQSSYNTATILRYRYHGAPTSDAVVVFLDEDSHSQLTDLGIRADYLHPWDRAKTHAKLIERLVEDGARAVIFDIVFSDAALDPAEDQVFASALKKMQNVILAADNAPQLQTGAGQQVHTAHEIFLEAITSRDLEAQIDDMAALQRHVGIDELVPDSDLTVRIHPIFNTNELFFPLSWVAAKEMGAPITRDPEAWKQTRWVNYYGPNQTIKNVSYWKAVVPGQLPPGFFKDKVVFVGSSLLTRASGARKDSYRSPFQARWVSSADEKSGAPDKTSQISGVEIQATIYANLMRGDWWRRLNNLHHFAAIVGIAFIVSLAAMFLRPARAVAFGVAVSIAISMAGYWLATYLHIITVWLIPVLCVALGTISSIAYNAYRLHMHRKLLQHSVSMYVSPAMADEVLRKPDMMKPGNARNELLSMIFTDIANFTTMSEGLDPHELGHLMNGYFETAVNQSIYPMQGTVVKFIGDAIFAIWNAPVQQENHRELACRAAIHLRDQVTDFKFNRSDVEVRTRIGLHTGTASVGNFGSSKRVDYTALGENVNLTARMEGLNKYLGTRILATGDIIEPVESKFTSRYLGRFQLKGFAKAVEVYELIGGPELAEPNRALIEQFAAGLEAFRRRDFDAAELAFKRVLQSNPKDGPSKFYLAQVNEFRVEPPDSNWSGDIELKEK
jgi:adenylate cyclase